MPVLEYISFIVYDIFILFYFKKQFPQKKTHWIFYILAIAVNLAAVTLVGVFKIHHYGILIILLSMLFFFYLLFQMTRLQILYAASIYVFSLYSSRGIIASIFAISLNAGINDILQSQIYGTLTTVLTVAVSILTSLFIQRFILPSTVSKHLLYNKGQLKFVVMYMHMQLIFLILLNQGRFLDVGQVWFSALYLLAAITSKLGLQFVFNHTARVSELLEYELHTHQLKEQLAIQLRHYQSYRKFTKSYQTFRHDYNNMMTIVKSLLLRHEYEKAALMLDDIHDTMQRDVLIHKTYSNNVILDAILHDAANTCEENNIKFTATAHLPDYLALTDLDIVRIFANLIDNALEACAMMSEGDRFIDITGFSNQDWTTIEVTNSYSGKLALKNGEIQTTKKNKSLHGLGLKIIRETIENLGGLFFIETDKEKIFKTKICLPKS